MDRHVLIGLMSSTEIEQKTINAGTEKAIGQRIATLRKRLGLTQARLADLLGVSNGLISFWETGRSNPPAKYWSTLERAEVDGLSALRAKQGDAESIAESAVDYGYTPDEAPQIDFGSYPEAVRAVVEAERFSFGHLFNPAFATEVSLVDPLPHQRIAVYQHMLPQWRLRFLLADDAGAGKTIMSGLYIREMLSRRLIRRVLIVPPAGLVGNWQREMRTLFSLNFKIVAGSDAKNSNPFAGKDSDLVIVSIDTLSSERMMGRLRETTTDPYDLVVFDEAHKLSARREPDHGMHKSERYKLAEALAGISTGDERWSLPWVAHHLLLLTATPHMGKDFPYFALWRLLEPEILPTLDAFNDYPDGARRRHFIRRTKEEMVRFDGTRIYPMRQSDTLSYDLSQGTASEQQLYDEMTDYIQSYYNRARILNRSAARLAMSVFQRRLASSTFAVLRSLERRLERLTTIIDDIRSGRLTEDQLRMMQRSLDKDTPDYLDETTADEEEESEGEEQHELLEKQALGAVVGYTLAELEAERRRVSELCDLAEAVYDKGDESKFEKLLEVLRDKRFKGEKMLIFTEHRDTLTYLVRRLEGIGFAGQVAQIHGGMHYSEREEQVELFRKDGSDGGAQYLIATDAAGEGINLQFCWLMVNYDIPWNPARLEQRMGRIHRYKQTHDPVVIVNLVAGKTREGRVLHVLLEKLESIRKELGSDKVFDSIGRLFEGVSLREYMERVASGNADAVASELNGKLTKEQVEALEERERILFGEGGDVMRLLPEEQQRLRTEELRRLLPGYVRRFVEKSAPLLDVRIDGDLDEVFSLEPAKPNALDVLLPYMEAYPEAQQNRFSLYKAVAESRGAVFLRPGERLFEQYRGFFLSRFWRDALRGGVFLDPHAPEPYIFHVAVASCVRDADAQLPQLGSEEPLDCRLVGIRQSSDGTMAVIPVEQLMLLRPATGVPISALMLTQRAGKLRSAASDFVSSSIAAEIAASRKKLLQDSLDDRIAFLKRGFDYQAAELAAARSRLLEKAQAGDAKAKGDLTKIKERQRALNFRRDEAIATLRREIDLIRPNDARFLAHALVVPSSDPEDVKRQDAEIEAIAVRVAWGHEEARGAKVRDVSKPELARAAGLGERIGFDLHSVHPEGEERFIEVKGRAAIGEVELTENEWAKACNLRERYWLYVVYNCATPEPMLYRIRDPFRQLLASPKGGVIIQRDSIVQAAEQ